MTENQSVETMQAGEELDDLIATQVMSWYKDGGTWRHHLLPDEIDNWECFCHKWNPSTDLVCAWRVVETTGLLKDGWGLTLQWNNLWAICAEDHGSLEILAEGETVPLVICRAALLSKSKEQDA